MLETIPIVRIEIRANANVLSIFKVTNDHTLAGSWGTKSSDINLYRVELSKHELYLTDTR